MGAVGRIEDAERVAGRPDHHHAEVNATLPGDARGEAAGVERQEVAVGLARGERTFYGAIHH